MRKQLLVLFFLSLLMVSFLPDAAAERLTGFPRVNLLVGNKKIKAELANTESQRATGLMHRKHLGADSGMLFDFSAPARVCMWMKNTYIPLSVAFIDDDGIIVNIEDMQPLELQSHCSKGWVRYALEMNQGWFAINQIGQGSKVEILP
jgi:hypothetical protein